MNKISKGNSMSTPQKNFMLYIEFHKLTAAPQIYPYTMTENYPQITWHNHDKKTTAYPLLCHFYRYSQASAPRNCEKMGSKHFESSWCCGNPTFHPQCSCFNGLFTQWEHWLNHGRGHPLSTNITWGLWQLAKTYYTKRSDNWHNLLLPKETAKA